jgi:Tol biopolymer transport system component
LVDLKTKQAEQLTFDEEDIVGLTWHPQGKQLIFGTQKADVRNGYAVELSSKKIIPLNISGFSYPAYAKKTGELYYQQRGEKYHIASLKLDETIATSPFPVIQSDFNHHYPDYSAINKKIVYVSNESGYYELWSADNQGRNRKQLTNLKQTIRYPNWSHDGTKIAFLAPVEHNTSDKIYILDYQSLKITVVPSPFSEHNRPTWSFDDSAIISAIYDHEYTDLHQINIKDGTVQRISFDGGRYGVMISPTEMLYTSTKRGLWHKNIHSKNPPLNKINTKSFNSTYSWTYQNNRVYYRHNNPGNHQIAYYDFTQQQNHPIVRLPLRTFEAYGTIAYVPEINKLIFAASQFPQADIKLLKHSLLE